MLYEEFLCLFSMVSEKKVEYCILPARLYKRYNALGNTKKCRVIIPRL